MIKLNFEECVKKISNPKPNSFAFRLSQNTSMNLNEYEVEEFVKVILKESDEHFQNQVLPVLKIIFSMKIDDRNLDNTKIPLWIIDIDRPFLFWGNISLQQDEFDKRQIDFEMDLLSDSLNYYCLDIHIPWILKSDLECSNYGSDNKTITIKKGTEMRSTIFYRYFEGPKNEPNSIELSHNVPRFSETGSDGFDRDFNTVFDTDAFIFYYNLRNILFSINLNWNQSFTDDCTRLITEYWSDALVNATNESECPVPWKGINDQILNSFIRN